MLTWRKLKMLDHFNELAIKRKTIQLDILEQFGR